MQVQEKVQTSPFCSLYKTFRIDQNKRREELLEEQKKRRENLVDEARGLNETLDAEEIDKPVTKNKYMKRCKYKIMLSEWFLEIPPDFDVSWFMKFCPDGHRNLVVAGKNITKSYSKKGKFEYQFKSLLPGGTEQYKRSITTVLDCIWSEKNNTFYILDVLLWGNQDFRNCEAEFRFYWLETKLSEHPEIETGSTNNTFSFKYVPHFPCDQFTIKKYLENYPHFDNNSPFVDGLLFYHKEASYTAGLTPLFGWLKPFMVPEILNIQVAEEYVIERPIDYINLPEHIEKLKRIKKEKRRKKNENNVEMEECE